MHLSDIDLFAVDVYLLATTETTKYCNKTQISFEPRTYFYLNKSAVRFNLRWYKNQYVPLKKIISVIQDTSQITDFRQIIRYCNVEIKMPAS